MPEPILIAMAGMVGVGKTTLAENLAAALSARLIREEYDRNPFLPRQLAGDCNAALPSELFFLFSRARQLHKNVFVEGEIAVCDYLFQKNRIFSQINLDPGEFAMYVELEETLMPATLSPTVVIYLHDTIDNCLERVRRRGRPYECEMTGEWLGKLCQGYNEILGRWDDSRVIQLDCGRYDVRRNEIVQALADQILNIPSAQSDTNRSLENFNFANLEGHHEVQNYAHHTNY